MTEISTIKELCLLPKTKRSFLLSFLDEAHKNNELYSFANANWAPNVGKLSINLARSVEKTIIVTYFLLNYPKVGCVRIKERLSELEDYADSSINPSLIDHFEYKRVGNHFESVRERFPHEAQEKYGNFVIYCLSLPKEDYTSIRKTIATGIKPSVNVLPPNLSKQKE